MYNISNNKSEAPERLNILLNNVAKILFLFYFFFYSRRMYTIHPSIPYPCTPNLHYPTPYNPLLHYSRPLITKQPVSRRALNLRRFLPKSCYTDPESLSHNHKIYNSTIYKHTHNRLTSLPYTPIPKAIYRNYTSAGIQIKVQLNKRNRIINIEQLKKCISLF